MSSKQLHRSFLLGGLLWTEASTYLIHFTGQWANYCQIFYLRLPLSRDVKGCQPNCKQHTQPFCPIFPVELRKCLPKIANSFAERLKTNSTSEGISYILYIIAISVGKKRMYTVFQCEFCIEQKDIILCLTQGLNSL